MNDNGLDKNVNSISLRYGNVLNYEAIAIDENYKIVVRKVARTGEFFVDVRIWRKWSQDQEFHPGNGIFVREDLFIRDVLPRLNGMFPGCLPQFQPQSDMKENQVTVEKRVA